MEASLFPAALCATRLGYDPPTLCRLMPQCLGRRRRRDKLRSLEFCCPLPSFPEWISLAIYQARFRTWARCVSLAVFFFPVDIIKNIESVMSGVLAITVRQQRCSPCTLSACRFIQCQLDILTDHGSRRSGPFTVARGNSRCAPRQVLV